MNEQAHDLSGSLGFGKAAGAAAALTLAGISAAVAVRGALPFLLVVALLGTLSLAYLAWHVDPAWTLTASIILSIFQGWWGQLGPLGSLPVPPDRLLLLAGALAVILRAPPVRNRPEFKAEPIHWLLLAALVFAAGSALAAGTFFSKSGFFRLFDRFGAGPFLMFALAPLVFASERRRNILLGALTALGAYLGLTALFETISLHALVVPRYILDPNLGFHVGRARGPFLEAEANGIALFFCAVSAIVAGTIYRQRAGIRIACSLVAVLCLAGDLFTLSRAVWLGTAVAIAVTLVSVRPLRRFLLPAVVGALGIVVIPLVLIPGLASSAGKREAEQVTLWDRANLNAAAARAIEAKPLLGVGWDRFADVSEPLFRRSPGRPLTAVGPQSCDSLPDAGKRPGPGGFPPKCTEPVHNSYLSNLAELGVVGGGLWVVALIFAFSGAIGRRGPPEFIPWRVGLLAITVMWAVVAFFTPLEGPFSPIVLWVWAGITWASATKSGGVAVSTS